MTASSSGEVKEVYARFGLAYYHAEVLHRGLCNLYALSRLPPEGGITRPRLEEHLSTAWSCTLGQIVSLVSPLLPGEIANELSIAIHQRNFLAHHFWYQRIHLITLSEGVSELLAELDSYSSLFQMLDAEVDKCTEPYNARLGITAEKLFECLNEVLQGKEPQPLIRQRRPAKEEVLTGVYEVPLGEEGSTLIFQTNDGLLWQLCDSGLGWTAYDRIEADWKHSEPFQKLLPVRINPRPFTNHPWQFEIRLGQVSLRVRPSSGTSSFQWSLATVRPGLTRDRR